MVSVAVFLVMVICALTHVARATYMWNSTGVGTPLLGHVSFDRLGGKCHPGTAISGLRFQRAGCKADKFWWDRDLNTHACASPDDASEGLVVQLRCTRIGGLLGEGTWKATGVGGPLPSHAFFDRVGAACGAGEVATGIQFVRGGFNTLRVKATHYYDGYLDYSTDPQNKESAEGLVMQLLCAPVPPLRLGLELWKVSGSGTPLLAHSHFDRVGGECNGPMDVASGFDFVRSGCGSSCFWTEGKALPMCASPTDATEGLSLRLRCHAFHTETPTHSATKTPTTTPSPSPSPPSPSPPSPSPLPPPVSKNATFPEIIPPSTKRASGTPPDQTRDSEQPKKTAVPVILGAVALAFVVVVVLSCLWVRRNQALQLLRANQLQATADRLRQEAGDAERGTCPICYNNPVDTVLLPCGHCVCGPCRSQCRQCPICRHDIMQSNRVFFAA
eukprot:TRINITY_DN6928_c0_g2_i2.p1 TRINITY_DN6928_c0_g2~~TRINITY_DN6928_c0_g2_i2.p1  ORF type:complete len:444 (-),score=45.22 TRINITY_DN6928_c0_g2_i2:275-1606(-)